MVWAPHLSISPTGTESKHWQQPEGKYSGRLEVVEHAERELVALAEGHEATGSRSQVCPAHWAKGAVLQAAFAEEVLADLAGTGPLWHRPVTGKALSRARLLGRFP